ncbi:PP2C family serine/threonine-protein phosphatase [Candidatus Marithrix sp. Canyon 246]|uniref:PP2C family serine/threonine-protein phosphatase n=2 Tax=Candidatus Marithrix sp. Canyon 246 TaxID=1827136 RepID=UPI0014960818|nr:PP2C family serine/threonine-protein phosphatase [Candidatus Marithrix sp. Canyon 246]
MSLLQQRMSGNQCLMMAASVRGATHKRHNIPNQDSIRCYISDAVILAISDGHGSKKSFRSDQGSSFAVKIATETIKKFVKSIKSYNYNLSFIKRLANEQLPKFIVQKWLAAVDADIRNNPFSEAELKILEGKTTIAYGATLLIVLVTEDFIIYWQLGDGNILTVWENNIIEQPILRDERLFANETTSLCIKDAWRDFSLTFQVITNKSPQLILLATDGYANSFPDDANFLKVASDITQLIKKEGSSFVTKNLEQWLTEASKSGSGDDITIGIIK